MLAGRGKYLLMVDADGATDISDLSRLLVRMKKIEKNGHGIVVGSRAHLVDNVVAKVCPLRTSPSHSISPSQPSSRSPSISLPCPSAEDSLLLKRTLLRNILMHGFHLFVKIVGVPNIKDTQCGFKLFTRKSASVLFPNLHVERWAFDVELLYLDPQY